MSLVIARIAPVVAFVGLLLTPLAAGLAPGGSPEDPPTWNLEAQVVSGDLGPGDAFGCCVAADGDYLVVGASPHDHSGLTLAGAAYVFVHLDGTWRQLAKLVAPDAANEDYFGYPVSISGDTVVVGAMHDDHAGGIDAGSAYVFVRNGSNWVFQAKLVAADAADEDLFGYVDVDGDTIVVGATRDDHSGAVDAGSTYVFARNGTTWVQQAKLISGRVEAHARLGRRVSVSGETAVMGYRKSVHVFQRQGTSWSEQVTLVPPSDLAPAWFGLDLALSGDTLAVLGKGKLWTPRFVIVYVLRGGHWVEHYRAGPYECNGVDNYLALDGDTLAVATNGWDNQMHFAGFVDLYVREEHGWGGSSPLNVDYEFGFGTGLAVDGDLVVAGNYVLGKVRIYRRE